MCLAAAALHYISNPIATVFCIILYRSSRPSLCVFRMLCGVCRHVVSKIIQVVSSVILVAASDIIHVFCDRHEAVKVDLPSVRYKLYLKKTLAFCFGFIVQTPD